MIPLAGLLTLVVNLVIVGLIFWLIFWALGKIGLPEPFNKVILVVVVLVLLLYLINLLIGFAGPGHALFR